MKLIKFIPDSGLKMAGIKVCQKWWGDDPDSIDYAIIEFVGTYEFMAQRPDKSIVAFKIRDGDEWYEYEETLPFAPALVLFKNEHYSQWRETEILFSSVQEAEEKLGDCYSRVLWPAGNYYNEKKKWYEIPDKEEKNG